MRIGIYIFNQVELLDFAGPYEVFSTARRLQNRDHLPWIETFTIGENYESIETRGHVKIIPSYTITEHPGTDILIIPGGVTGEEEKKNHVIGWLAAQAQTSAVTGSICTGAFLLAKAGLLDGIKATTHWEDIDDLMKSYPAIDIIRNQRYVDQGKIITSAGISAGIDMSLYLVKRFFGESLASKTARQMDYKTEAGLFNS
jgi:transcriptional regulator GlxA family with amidase domain